MTNEQKKQYVKEYIRSLKAIEDCIEPYQNKSVNCALSFARTDG